MKLVIAYIRHEAFEPIRMELLRARLPVALHHGGKGLGSPEGHHGAVPWFVRDELPAAEDQDRVRGRRGARLRVLARLRGGLRAGAGFRFSAPPHPRHPQKKPSFRPGQGFRRWQSAWLRRAGVDLEQLAGSGPGGRIVKVDVERAGVCRGWRRRGYRPRGSFSYRRGRWVPCGDRTRGRNGRSRNRKGPNDLRGPQQAAVDHRPSNGRVEGDRASLLPLGRDRHERRGRGSDADESDGRSRTRSFPPSTTWSSRPAPSPCASIPRANGAYRDGRFELYSRVNVGVAVAGRRRAGRPDRLRRRPQGAAADRLGVPRPGAAGPRRPDHPAGAVAARPSPSPIWGCTGSTASRR